MFNPGDKVVRVGWNPPGCRVIKCYNGGVPQFGPVYVVSDCWDTTIGPLCVFVGLGPPAYEDGFKVGWPCSAFRKLEEIRAENTFRAEAARHYASGAVPNNGNPGAQGIGRWGLTK